MAMETWGLVPKAQDESQTIDEAITAAIADHEADENAHVEEGESLYGHKSDTTIDHPAESVINDKYAPFSLDPLQLDNSKINVNQAAALAGKYKITNYLDSSGGESYLGAVTGEVDGNVESYFYADFDQILYQIAFASKKFLWEATIWIEAGTDYTVWAGCGSAVEAQNNAGFKVINGTIYAWWKATGSLNTQELQEISELEYTRLRIFNRPGEGIDFYINGILVFTATTDLPNDNASGNTLYFKIKQNTANTDALAGLFFPYFASEI